MALNQARPKKRRRPMKLADRQIEAVVEVLRSSEIARTPGAQAALVVALLRAMGGPLGVMPNLVDIATELGICHQRAYRMLGVLEGKGVVKRNLVEIVL